MENSVKKFGLDDSLKDKQVDSNQIEKQINNILTYDVLRIIFQYLSAKDLSSVSHTCRSWKDAANNEIFSRRAPECIIKNFQVIDKNNSEDSFNATLLGNELRIKPSFGLVCIKVQNNDEWTPKGCYCENLPTKCNTIILGGYDITMNDVKVENKFGMAACAFLPDIPKLNRMIYHVDVDTFKDVLEKNVKIHADKTAKLLLPSKSEKSKCIIVLTNQDGVHYTKFILQALKKSYKPGTLSLWGGICVDLKLCKKFTSPRTCAQTFHWTAITLSSPTLQSWSIVLLHSCRSESRVQEKLENFKKSISLQKHSLALMFSCCARMLWKDMEVTVFKRVFQSVPLIGLHGDGEFGLNTLSEKCEDLMHTYSTIFIILTYQ